MKRQAENFHVVVGMTRLIKMPSYWFGDVLAVVFHIQKMFAEAISQPSSCFADVKLVTGGAPYAIDLELVKIHTPSPPVPCSQAQRSCDWSSRNREILARSLRRDFGLTLLKNADSSWYILFRSNYDSSYLLSKVVVLEIALKY